MKRLVMKTMVVALILAFSATAYAETEWSYNGQIRSRGFMDKRTFVPDAEYVSWHSLRTRFGIMATKDDNAHAFIQFQDSRDYGAGTQSGSLNSTANVDIHQAYITIDNLFGEGWGVQTGRFEFAKGNERVFGSVGWDNVGRSWEGAQFWYDTEKLNISLYSLKKMETKSGPSQDFDVVGIYATIKDMNWDIFINLDRDGDSSGFLSSDTVALERISFGTYYHRMYDQFDFTLNYVLQTGTGSATDGLGNTYEVDIAAFMAAFEVGYSMQDERNTRIAFGIDMASGDDGTDTLENKTYNNLYYTGHKFRGSMDYFLGSDMPGLTDIYFGFNTDVTDGWTVGAKFHMFSTAEDYSWTNRDDPDPLNWVTATSSDVGTEFDITVSTNRVAGVKLDWGFSIFSAKDSFAGSEINNEAGTWSYGTVTIDF